MSLSTRVIAGIGAVVVIGAATIGGSIAYASNEGAPEKLPATLVVGSSSLTHDPLCGDGKKAFSKAEIADCLAKIKSGKEGKTLPSSDVRFGDKIGVGVEPGVGDRGWFAFTDGGSAQGQGQAPIIQDAKKVTFSGLLASGPLLNASGQTVVTVVEADPKTGEDYAVWAFVLNQKD